MSRSNQQRRANRKRLNFQQQRQTQVPQSPPTQVNSVEELRALVILGARYAVGPSHHKGLFARVAAQLGAFEEGFESLLRPSQIVHSELVAVVGNLYEAGWQPNDVVHAVKRELTVRASRLAIEVVAAQARTADVAQRAPHVWLSQLEDLGAYNAARAVVVGGHANAVSSWAKSEQLHAEESIGLSLQVLGLLQRSPRQPVLVDPPSAWGASNRGVMPAARSSHTVDAKALKLIRALLAKAEATNFDAEADAFTSKAQEMMTRHSIDAAVLAASARGATELGVESRRVHIDSPYADEKAGFLAVLAEVNGARCVWSPQVGSSTIVGFPVDLQLIELLFTSLLVQATHASALATANDRELRTASFRRAFLVAFADRIGERLTETKGQAATEAAEHYGASLLPILASREEAVVEAFEQAFPDVTSMPARRLNASGWYAGRAAADAAKIGESVALSRGR